MLRWLGSTSDLIVRLDDLTEAKAKLGQVKFQKGQAGAKWRKVWVKVSETPNTSKTKQWLYWMEEPAAIKLGITDGSIVSITKAGKPVKPGDVNPDTGKVAGPPIPKDDPQVSAFGAKAPTAPAPAPAVPASKEEPKAEEPPKEEPKAEEPPKEEPKAEEPPKEEPKAEEPPKEEPKAEEPPKEEPKAEPPVVDISDPKSQELIAYLKGLPGFSTDAAKQKQYLSSVAFTKQILNKYGAGWLDKYKAGGGIVFGAKDGLKVVALNTQPGKEAAEKMNKLNIVPESASGVFLSLLDNHKKLTSSEFETVGGFSSDFVLATLKYLVKAGLVSIDSDAKFQLTPKWDTAGEEEPIKALPKNPPPLIVSGLGSLNIAPQSLQGQTLYALMHAGMGANATGLTVTAIAGSTGMAVADVSWALKKLGHKDLVHFDGDYYHPSGKAFDAFTTKATAQSIVSPEPAKLDPISFAATMHALGIHPESPVGELVSALYSNNGVLDAETTTYHSIGANWLLNKGYISKDATGSISITKAFTDAIAAPPSDPSAPVPATPTPTPTPTATDVTVTPAAEPSSSKKKKKTEPSSSVQALLTPASIGSIPNASELELEGSAQHLGGQGEKYLYRKKGDKTGTKYLFKVAVTKDSGDAKPFAAHVQESYSRVAIAVKPGHLPIKVMELEGKFGTIQPFLSDTTNLEKGKGGDPVIPSALSPQEHEDVASEFMLDWVMSQHDTYAGNLVRTKTGRIFGVDKEQAFRFFGTDKLELDWKTPNPIQPYYNQFWSAWVGSEFEFDPKKLKPYIDRLDSISDADYTQSLSPYIESFWNGKPKEQTKYMGQMLKRKQTARSDFENFFTSLYLKKTGASDGQFTFNAGWVPASPTFKKQKPVGPSSVVKKYTAAEYVHTYPSISVKGSYLPKGGTPDTTKIGIRTNGDASQLINFAKELGLVPWKTPNSDSDGIDHGASFKWMFFHKADWDKATVEKTETIVPSSFPDTDPEPSYLQTHKATYPKVLDNLHEIANLEHINTGPTGKHFVSDGPAVEGEQFRVRRYIDPKGQPYYMFHFKLRESAWKPYAHKGVPAKFGFHLGAYDETKDAIVLNYNVDHLATTRKWTAGSSEFHLCADDDTWTYRGAVYTKVIPKEGQTPAEAFKELLDAVDPKLSQQVLASPTPEDRELHKLSRMLWSVAPKLSDNLPESKRTVSKLKAMLSDHGVDQKRIDSLQWQEVYPGYSTWVEPGRWKSLAGGTVRFVSEGVKHIEGAVGAMQHALMGGHERDLAGIGNDNTGASVPTDMANGSGDGILGCVATAQGLTEGMNNHGTASSKTLTGLNSYIGSCGVGLIYAPDILDRLDVYSHIGDCYGAASPLPQHSHHDDWISRDTLDHDMTLLSKKYTHHEVSFRRGLPASKLLRVACVANDGLSAENVRKKVLQQAHQAGIKQVNGIPVEDFVVAVPGEAKVLYDKYIKPLGY